ncbi:MAG: zinc ribbon domain-containing protein, partial [Desulfobacterales bacterium]|nr:zinc ribbon domain-containing protein [Desulfobacterales bacterium]
MPIYEYECRFCDAQFQSLIMNNEEERGLVCPNCHGKKLKKLISRVVYHVSEQDRLDAYDPSAP